jgi:enoyl-CoA hydratase
MQDDILFERRGVAGFITLNRPKALNAVTDAMVNAIARQLDLWESDNTVERVVIRAEGERAFSAGGDIVALYEAGIAGRPDLTFFAREYALNHRIATYPKPYVALVDGIAMGGGVGVSFHGSHVIAGPNAAFAMPEVGIGFFPDIGASHFLSRLPHNFGLCLGLTGYRVKQRDMLASGLATHAAGDMKALEIALEAAGPLDAILAAHTVPAEPGELMANRHVIAEAFASANPIDIINVLDVLADGGDFVTKLSSMMQAHSPTSLYVAHRQLTEAASLDLGGCLAMDYRIVARMLHGTEFYEGIRAAVIDKDREPNWSPADLRNVEPAKIDTYFAPLEQELQLS